MYNKNENDKGYNNTKQNSKELLIKWKYIPELQNFGKILMVFRKNFEYQTKRKSFREDKTSIEKVLEVWENKITY